MARYIFVVIPYILFAFLVSPARAASTGDIVINEIAWMGGVNSYTDEWIELYNNTDTLIALEGWILRATDGKPNISLEKTIAPKGFFLLERTNDVSVPDISADQIYTGDLGNSGEHLELLDARGNLIDRVNAFGSSWIGWGGDNTTKQTMERINPKLTGSASTSWKTSLTAGGTPKAQNSVYSTQESQISDTVPAPGPAQGQQNLSAPPNLDPALELKTQPDESEKTAVRADTDNNAPANTQAHTAYPSNIFINELMPYPLGPDELEEWVEIINENSEPADISLWQIKDTLGATNIYALPKGTIIAARGFLVLSRLTTNITMNNDGDAVQIIRPDGELAQTVPYEKAEKGKSFVRESGLWKWSSVPTPGSANIVPAPLKNAGTISDVKEVVKKASPNKVEVGAAETTTAKQLASVGEASSGKLSSRLTAFIASFIALLSAAFIFLLKKRLA